MKRKKWMLRLTGIAVSAINSQAHRADAITNT